MTEQIRGNPLDDEQIERVRDKAESIISQYHPRIDGRAYGAVTLSAGMVEDLVATIDKLKADNAYLTRSVLVLQMPGRGGSA